MGAFEEQCFRDGILCMQKHKRFSFTLVGRHYEQCRLIHKKGNLYMGGGGLYMEGGGFKMHGGRGLMHGGRGPMGGGSLYIGEGGLYMGEGLIHGESL